MASSTTVSGRSDPEIARAEELPLSVRKVLRPLLTGSVALVIGVLGFFLAFATLTAWLRGEVNLGFACIMGALFSIAAVSGLSFGGIAIAAMIAPLRHRDRLLLGEKCLLCVSRDGEIFTRVPYDNMAAIEVTEIRLDDEDEGDDAYPCYQLGISFIDPARNDMVMRQNSPLAPKGETEFDVYIRDIYQISPQELREKLLLKCRQQATRE